MLARASKGAPLPLLPTFRERKSRRSSGPRGKGRWSTTGVGGSGTGSTWSVTTFRAGLRLLGFCVLSVAASSLGARIARRVRPSVGVGGRCGVILVGSRAGGPCWRSGREAFLPRSRDRPRGSQLWPVGEWLVSCVAEATGPDPRAGQPHLLVRRPGDRGSSPQAGPGAGGTGFRAPGGLLRPQPERGLNGPRTPAQPTNPATALARALELRSRHSRQMLRTGGARRRRPSDYSLDHSPPNWRCIGWP